MSSLPLLPGPGIPPRGPATVVSPVGPPCFRARVSLMGSVVRSVRVRVPCSVFFDLPMLDMSFTGRLDFDEGVSDRIVEFQDIACACRFVRHGVLDETLDVRAALDHGSSSTIGAPNLLRTMDLVVATMMLLMSQCDGLSSGSAVGVESDHQPCVAGFMGGALAGVSALVGDQVMSSLLSGVSEKREKRGRRQQWV